MVINMKSVTLPVWLCNLCRHEWIGRKKGRPVECPKCKRRDWDKKR